MNFELISKKDEISKEKEDYIKLANNGAKLYFNKEWENAIKVFDKILILNNDDIPAKLLLERCKQFQKTPPGKDWNGIYVFNEKF